MKTANLISPKKEFVQRGNQYYLSKEGIIYIFLKGDQPAATLKKESKEIFKLLAQLEKLNKQKNMMVNVRLLGGINLAARKMGISIAREQDFDKMAILESNFITKN